MKSPSTLILIRHGKPLFTEKYSPFSLISGKDIGRVILDYNKSELAYCGEIRKENLRRLCQNTQLFLCSDLKRTKDSFSQLDISCYVSDKIFNEAEMPSGFSSWIILPLFLWALLLRVLWAVGVTNGSESFSAFRLRIKNTADVIENYSKTNTKTVLMGHGFMNAFLAKELKLRGWHEVARNGGSTYWSTIQLISY